MSKKAEHIPEPEPEEQDDIIQPKQDASQPDAVVYTTSAEPEPGGTPDVDLTHILNALWPGNPPNRTGNWYFDLNRLSLESGQTGLIGNIIANFVFERVDVHCINTVSSECRIELFTKIPDFKEGRVNLGWFTVNGKRTWRETNGHDDLAGTYMGGLPMYMQLHDPLPDAGRIVINLVGYLIEPWR